MQLTIPPVGVLTPGELLTLAAFKSRMALTDSAVRSMRRDGLPVLRVGKRHFVNADDAIEHIKAKSRLVGSNGFA